MAFPCPLRVFRVSVVKKRNNHGGTESTEATEATDYAPSSTIPISPSVSPHKLVPQSIDLPLEQLLGRRRLGVGESLVQRQHARHHAPPISWPCFGLLAGLDFGPMMVYSVSSCEPRLLPQKGRDIDIIQQVSMTATSGTA